MEAQEQLRAELQALVPTPGMSGSDWNDVLSRTGRRRSTLGRRASTVAIVALSLGLLAASPLAGAITGGVADFSAWLTGQPGTPASSQEQREFERANSRSWAQFPDSPALRRLITTQVAGASFELLGFRTGDSLCLRLVARGLPGAEGNGANAPATSCAPLRELRSARAPALVVLTDHPFGAGELPADAPPDSYARARAQATAGIVADGVRRLLLEDQRGEHQALVASNAFLFVAERPPVGTRTRRAFALGEDGQRIDVPLAQAPFGTSQTPDAARGEPSGPSQIERKLAGGSIGWLERHEPRGHSPEELGLTRLPISPNISGGQVFARVLEPDPSSSMRMLLALADPPPGSADEQNICVGVISPGIIGSGCSPARSFFPGRPFTVGFGGSDQYVTISGAATDDVARMELYLATGDRGAASRQRLPAAGRADDVPGSHGRLRCAGPRGRPADLRSRSSE